MFILKMKLNHIFLHIDKGEGLQTFLIKGKLWHMLPKIHETVKDRSLHPNLYNFNSI